MRQTLLLFALLFFSFLTKAQEKHWLDGHWQGIGHQPNALTNPNWRMELTFSADYVHIHYPEFPCGGKWERVKSTNKVAVFVERLETGLDRCLNNSRILVRKKGKNTILVIYYNPNGTEEARAKLSKTVSRK